MDANQTELRATETLLQRGVRVKVRAPLFLRLLLIKTVTITLRPPTAGALSRMGYWFLTCQLSLDKLEEISMEYALLYQVRYSDNISKALACLFLVGEWRTKLFMKPYAKWLKNSLTHKQSVQLLQYAILHGGLEDFMTTTRLVRAKMITPPKVGQQTKRS